MEAQSWSRAGRRQSQDVTPALVSLSSCSVPSPHRSDGGMESLRSGASGQRLGAKKKLGTKPASP